MAKKIISQTSFNAGEISPKLYGRENLERYKNALKKSINCDILPQGPVVKRSGSKYAAEIKDSSKEVKLISFKYSQDDAFIIELGDTYARFYKNQAQVLESNLTITGITQANPGVVTSTGHLLSNGDHVYITGVSGMTEVNSIMVPYLVANVTANTFELQTLAAVNVDTTAYTAYSSGGVINRIYEVSSVYTEAQLSEIEYIQNGNDLYFTHPDVSPRRLTRTADTDWTFEELSFEVPVTYEAGDEPTTTVTPAATSGASITFTSGVATFKQADVGRQIVNNATGETGRAAIISYTTNTAVVCDIIETFTDTNPIASGDWTIDSSPVAALEFTGTSKGSVINIRSEYLPGTLGDRLTITGITNANPGVVTTSASHGLSAGDKVQIQDINGMTQLNGNIYTLGAVTATTFELKDDNNVNVDTTAYTTYSANGIARKTFSGLSIGTFRNTDADKYLLLNGGVVKVLNYTSSTEINCEIVKSLNSDDLSTVWTKEIESWDATRGYPRAVGFHEQRLYYGGTIIQPQTLWGSEIGSFLSFGVGPDDEDSLEITLSSNVVNEINWIIGSRDLVIGTSGAEITLTGGSGGTITPSNTTQKTRTSVGSAIQRPVSVNEEIIYIGASRRDINSFRYDFNIDGYRSEDITTLADHLTEDRVTELALSNKPDRKLFAVTDVGNIVSIVYDRETQILAFSSYTTDGYYENIQVIGNGSVDEVWTVVKRTVNGNTKRYIEVFDNGTGAIDVDGYVDSFLTLDNPLCITSISLANPAVVTSTSHGLSNGDKVILKSIQDPLPVDLDATKTNMSSLNDCSFTIANVTTHTFELSGLDTSNYNAYLSSGSAFLKVTTISGLEHLEGKSVTVKTDGAAHPNKTVSSGSITLDVSAGQVVVGLNYDITLQTLNLPYDLGMGTMQGRRTGLFKQILRLYKSYPPIVNGEFIPARNAADSMDKKVPLFSGDIEYVSSSFDDAAQLTITQSGPFPLQVSAIFTLVDGGV